MSARRCSPGDPREREHIADILLTSRRQNSEAEVTGALLASDARFTQGLEGEKRAVEDTYGRITHDNRHKDIVLLLTEPIAARQFPEWSMAYIGPSQSAAEAVARVTQNLPADDGGSAARGLVTFMSQMLATCGDGFPAPDGPASSG